MVDKASWRGRALESREERLRNDKEWGGWEEDRSSPGPAYMSDRARGMLVWSAVEVGEHADLSPSVAPRCELCRFTQGGPIWHEG